MKRFLCFLTGHKYIFTEGQNGFCGRCSHNYISNIESYESGFIRKNKPSLTDILVYFFTKIYSTCPHCKKPRYVFGIRLIKKHTGCAPF